MNHRLKFRCVPDPAHSATTHAHSDGLETDLEKPISGFAIGAFNRFTEEFGCYMRQMYPDMVVGDDLTIYHLDMPEAEMKERIRKIELHCDGWAGYNEMDKTPL